MERVRRNPKITSKSKSMTLARPQSKIFGEPLLLEDEDRAAYEELLARLREAVKPADIVDEMYVADAVELEWELLRWRRFEFALIRACRPKALKSFLAENLEYDLYKGYFTDDLSKVLQGYSGAHPQSLSEGEEAQTLVDEYVRNEPGAARKVERVLRYTSTRLSHIEQGARARKAEELVQEYLQHTPRAVGLIDKLLERSGVSMDSLVASRLGKEFDYIERIDRLITIAENRRDAFLREIERRRAVVGESLRRTVQEIEDGEFKLIETTPAKGKDAA